MKEILFAANTFRECNQFLNDLANDLFERGIHFDIDKYKMSIKTEFAHLVCVPKTSGHSGLYQRHPFDYHLLTGDAMFDSDGFHDFCIARTKIGAKPIEYRDELIELMKGESE